MCRCWCLKQGQKHYCLEGGVGPRLGGGDEPLCVLPGGLGGLARGPRLAVGAADHPLDALDHPEWKFNSYPDTVPQIFPSLVDQCALNL